MGSHHVQPQICIGLLEKNFYTSLLRSKQNILYLAQALNMHACLCMGISIFTYLANSMSANIICKL